MVITSHDLNKLKIELVALLKDELLQQIQQQTAEFNKKINDSKDEIILKLRDENATLKAKVEELESRIVLGEITTSKLDQYNRRNNLVFDGIPNTVTNLEETVIKLCEKININFCSSDVEACHRLGKSNKTIVRFVNRKFCGSILKEKGKINKLKMFNDFGFDGKIFVSSNLSKLNDKISFYCRKLKKARSLSKYWFYSGSIYVKRNDDEEGYIIQHPNELSKMFPLYDFDDV